MPLPLIVTEDGLAGRESLTPLLHYQVSTLLEAGFGWSALPTGLRSLFCLCYYKGEVENGGHGQFMSNAVGFHGGVPVRILAWAAEGARDLGLTETGAVIAAFQEWINAHPDDLVALADLDIDRPEDIKGLDQQLYQADRDENGTDLAEARADAKLRDWQPRIVVGQDELSTRLREQAQGAIGPDAPAIPTRRLRQDVQASLPDARSGLFLRLLQGTPYAEARISTVETVSDGVLAATTLDQLTRLTCTVEAGMATLRQAPTERAGAMIEVIPIMRRSPIKHLLGLVLDTRYRRAMAANGAKLARLRQQDRDTRDAIATLPAMAGAELVERLDACCIAEALTLICMEQRVTLGHGLRAHLPRSGAGLRVAIPATDQSWVLLEADGKKVAAHLNQTPVFKRDLGFLLDMKQQLDAVVD